MSLIDDFESAFQACLAPFTNPTSSHVFDNDELKANADNIQRLLDISRQIESFFIQKRAILADQRPELILTEEINELKVEINRKEALLNKYHDKLGKWTSQINDACNGKSSPNLSPTGPPMPWVAPTGNQMPMRMGQPMPPNMTPMNPLKMQNVGSPNVNSNVNSPMMLAQSPLMNQIRPQNSPMVGSPMNPQQMPQGLQGPLAYLERTVGMTGR